MKKLFPALLAGVLTAGLFALPAIVQAQSATPVEKKVTKKKQKSRAKKAAPAPFALAVPDEDDTGAPIDPAKAMTVDYQCDLGATVTIFHNADDNDYIALRYEKLLTRMKRVGTTTGANRFENKRSGLVWIGIPAKGILLDAKHGHQLANECKDADQLKPTTASPNTTPAVVAPTAPSTASTTVSTTAAPTASPTAQPTAAQPTAAPTIAPTAPTKN